MKLNKTKKNHKNRTTVLEVVTYHKCRVDTIRINRKKQGEYKK